MGKTVKTTFKCLHCSRKLVIEETMGVMMFGCPRCQCYVIVTENRVKEYVYGSMFSWKRLMKDLYNAYKTARQHICSR
jgi:DNA-directed RNA polymerase subunit RPC12/RpoP